MKRVNPIIIVGLSILVLFTAAIVYLRYTYFPKYNWSETYRLTKEEPYDIKLFHTLLKSSVEKDSFETFTYNPYTFKDSAKRNQSFILFNSQIPFDSIAYKTLLRTVALGNDLLVITKHPGEMMNEFIKRDSSRHFSLYGLTNVDHVNASIAGSTDTTRFYYQRGKAPQQYGFGYFSDTLFTMIKHEIPIRTLGFINDTLIHCIKIKHGKGNIILHLNPIFFTNYHLCRDSVSTYVNNVLSEIHTQKIIWFRNTFSSYAPGAHLTQGPIHYIISQRAFRNAWYMLIALVLLAVIFGAKRKQSIIPYHSPLKNGSVEYASIVATFYYQSRNHSFIATEMMRLFWVDLKNRYNLAKHSDRSKIIKPLADYTGIPESHFVQLFRAEANVMYSNSQDSDYITELHQLLEHYYKKRK